MFIYSSWKKGAALCRVVSMKKVVKYRWCGCDSRSVTKILIAIIQVNLCWLIPASLGIGTKLTWIVVVAVTNTAIDKDSFSSNSDTPACTTTFDHTWYTINYNRWLNLYKVSQTTSSFVTSIFCWVKACRRFNDLATSGSNHSWILIIVWATLFIW